MKKNKKKSLQTAPDDLCFNCQTGKRRKNEKNEGKKMLKTQHNLKLCAEILEALNGGVHPADPVVTFGEGSLDLLSKERPLQPGEIVLCDLEAFGDGWEEAAPEDVFAFINEHFGPEYHEFTVYMASGAHDVYKDVRWFDISEIFCLTHDFEIPWYCSAIMSALHDQVGIGELHSSDENAWILLSKDDDDLSAYEGPFELALTKSFNDEAISVIE